MPVSPIISRYDGEGLQAGYRNDKWVVCIKNWKPDNDLDGLKHLEIHHQTDEQFILISGKAILITAEITEDNGFDLKLTKLETGVLYTVPVDGWFFTILEKETKMMIIQDSGCTAENSEYRDLNEAELNLIRAQTRELFS